MAEHAGPSLAKKLGLKPGFVVVLGDAPPGWEIAAMPPGVVLRRLSLVPAEQPSRRSPGKRPDGFDTAGRGLHAAGSSADLTLLFVRQFAELERTIADLAGRLDDDAILWIAWPRKAAGHVSDLTDQRIREEVLTTGLVDTKVAALDEDWSGLKFVRRKELRGGAAAQPRS